MASGWRFPATWTWAISVKNQCGPRVHTPWTKSISRQSSRPPMIEMCTSHRAGMVRYGRDNGRLYVNVCHPGGEAAPRPFFVGGDAGAPPL
jgi:hypothetical protein